ncbi:hypothetical protein CDL15_Pgr010307 [Punica granatum]|uniref:U-box domain-containing protein 4-like n=1 Tax=Punica granatum TaxID=22663 RepID=A0A218W1Z0_PUNGR|nr:hypothetical protein CDL15_Pgr010307 [Punica granatum]
MVLICIDSNDPIMQEEALSLVLNLNLNDDNKVVLVTERAIGKIATALRDNLASCRALAATIIMSLAVVEVNMTLIGEKRAIAGGVVPILLDIVDSGLKRAIEVLGLLAKYKEGRGGVGFLSLSLTPSVIYGFGCCRS